MYLTKQQAAEIEDRAFAHTDAAHDIAMAERLYGPDEVLFGYADEHIARANMLWWLADNLSDAHRATNMYPES